MTDNFKEGIIYAAIFAIGQVVMDYFYGRGTDVWGLIVSTAVAAAVFVWIMPKAKKFWEKTP